MFLSSFLGSLVVVFEIVDELLHRIQLLLHCPVIHKYDFPNLLVSCEISSVL
jgi:hypothetical protein